MAPSKRMFSLALKVRVRRHQRPRVGSVSGMLQDRSLLQHLGLRNGDRLVSEFLLWLFFREDGQILHGQSEEGEAGGDNAASDGQFGPLGEVADAGGTLEPGDADVHAVGDETEDDRNGRKVKAIRARSHFRL